MKIPKKSLNAILLTKLWLSCGLAEAGAHDPDDSERRFIVGIRERLISFREQLFRIDAKFCHYSLAPQALSTNFSAAISAWQPVETNFEEYEQLRQSLNRAEVFAFGRSVQGSSPGVAPQSARTPGRSSASGASGVAAAVIDQGLFYLCEGRSFSEPPSAKSGAEMIREAFEKFRAKSAPRIQAARRSMNEVHNSKNRAVEKFRAVTFSTSVSVGQDSCVPEAKPEMAALEQGLNSLEQDIAKFAAGFEARLGSLESLVKSQESISRACGVRR